MAGKQQQGGETGAKKASERTVKYVGTADRRVISAADWKSVGVEDQKQVVWDKGNNFTVPAGELDAKALAYLDESDDTLVVSGDTED